MSWHSRLSGKAGGRLNGEALAALGTASVDYRAAAASLHANEKTMGALAARNGRLESAFHG